MIQARPTTNPFPGLRPFETEEYRLFFGREGQSDELIARLSRARFLAVVGAEQLGMPLDVLAELGVPAWEGPASDDRCGWSRRPGSAPTAPPWNQSATRATAEERGHLAEPFNLTGDS